MAWANNSGHPLRSGGRLCIPILFADAFVFRGCWGTVGEYVCTADMYSHPSTGTQQPVTVACNGHHHDFEAGFSVEHWVMATEP